jgi:type IV pilus assembly protein PilX
MRNQGIHIDNQDGSMLVISMLILVLLTLVGVSASTNTEVELRIADNDRSHKINVYGAESGAMLAAQQMENETNITNLRDLTPAWLQPRTFLDSDDIHSPTIWASANNTSEQGMDANNRYLALYRGVASGSSLDMSASTLHEYALYGRSESRRGTAIVQLGYKKRF